MLSGLFSRIFLPRLKRNRSNKKPAGAAIADSYHGKVVPIDAAKQLVTVGEDIRLENLEQIIPYGQARDIVLTTLITSSLWIAHVVQRRVTLVGLWMYA